MSVRALLTAVALLMPVAALAEVQSYSEEWDGRPAPRSEAMMRAVVLATQNHARAAYGSPPLVWDEALAASAQSYARKLAAENSFAHDPQLGNEVRQGENLWMGTRQAFDYATMTSNWIDERRDVKPGRFPDVSRSGNWARVGHYTQLVWPTTTSMGCAMASNAANEFLVCRYLPAGNVIGVAMR